MNISNHDVIEATSKAMHELQKLPVGSAITLKPNSEIPLNPTSATSLINKAFAYLREAQDLAEFSQRLTMNSEESESIVFDELKGLGHEGIRKHLEDTGLYALSQAARLLTAEMFNPVLRYPLKLGETMFWVTVECANPKDWRSRVEEVDDGR